MILPGMTHGQIVAALRPERDTANAPADVKDDAVRTWYTVLTDVLGLDPAPYADVSDALDHAAAVSAWAHKWRTTTTLDEHAAANLVDAADTFTDAAATVSAAVRATNDDERAAGARIFARAYVNATHRALTALSGHRDHTFAELQRVYAESVAATLAAADTLTAAGSPTNSDQAHRAGVIDAWDAIDHEKGRRRVISHFVDYATTWGVLPHEGKLEIRHGSRNRTARDYGTRRYYQHPQKAATLHEYRHLWRDWPAWKFDAHVLRVAEAALRSTADADTTPEPLTPTTFNDEKLDRRRRTGTITRADLEHHLTQ